MAFQYLVNQTPATCAVAVWNIVNFLINTVSPNPWTKTKDSDGTTYSSSGTQVTSGSSGTHGLDNNKAWFVINQPGSTGSVGRSFCFQRQTTTGANTSYAWRIKYSKALGFVNSPIGGGSIDATHTPSASDEVIILGAGTDASPTFDYFVNTVTDGGFRQQIVADNASVGSGSGGSFLTFGWANSTGATTLAFGLEALLSYAAADTDPWIVHSVPYRYASTNYCWYKTYMLYSGASRQFGGWYNTTFYYPAVTYPGLYAVEPSVYVGAGTAYSIWANSGQNLDSKDDGIPIMVFLWNYVAAPNNWWKGILSMTRMCAQTGRSTTDLVNVSSSRDGIVVGQCILPWDGASEPTL